MDSSKIKEITLTGLFIALIIVMTFVPFTGYITYGGISITTLHVVVIIGAITLGRVGGFILGLVWGILCLVLAYTSGMPEALIFMNPLISVVPRAIVGLVVGILADLFRGKKDLKKYSMICGVVGSLTNTVLVMTAIGFFGGETLVKFGDTVGAIFQALVAVNGIVELGLAIFVTPILVSAISKVYPVNVKKDKKKD